MTPSPRILALQDKFRDCGNVVYANVMKDDDGESQGRVEGPSARVSASL